MPKIAVCYSYPSLSILFTGSSAQRIQCFQSCGSVELGQVETISDCCAGTLNGGAFILQGNSQCRSCDNFQSEISTNIIGITVVCQVS